MVTAKEVVDFLAQKDSVPALMIAQEFMEAAELDRLNENEDLQKTYDDLRLEAVEVLKSYAFYK